MITNIKQNSVPIYTLKEYVVDSEKEICYLPKEYISQGSIAFVIENSSLYMLNGQKEWVKI